MSRPSGPRTRQPPASGPPPVPKGRDEAFSEIFGRRNTHNLHSQQHQQQPPLQPQHQQPPQQPPHHLAQQRAYPGQYPQVYSGGPGGGPNGRSGATAAAGGGGGTGYDVYAGSVGLGLPPVPSGGQYPAYGYPNQYPTPQPQPNPSRQPGYDRRASLTPSVYSNAGPSASSTSLHQPSLHPQQHLSPYPPSSASSMRSGYQPQGGPPQSVSYANSSPNLALPNSGVQRNRTQSSTKSTMGDSWDNQSVPNVPSSMTSSSSAPYSSGTDEGKDGLTPAQAYQAQVGVEAGAGGGALRGPRPPRPAQGPGSYFPSAQPSSVPPHLAPSIRAPYDNLSNTHHSSPTLSSASSVQSAASSSQHSSYSTNSPLPNPHSTFIDHGNQHHYSSTPSNITPSSSSIRPPRLPSFDGSMGSSGLGFGTLPSLSMESDGGMITPRPSAYDDSELGYLGSAGTSGQNSTFASRDPSIRSGHSRNPSESSSRSVLQPLPDSNSIRSQFAPLTRIDTQRSSSPSQLSPATLPGDRSYLHRNSSGRDSVDSSRSAPSISRGNSSADLRSTSFSHPSGRPDTASIRSVSRSSTSNYPQMPNLPPSSYNFPSPHGASISKKGGSITAATRKQLQIYPAFLSRVAEAFRTTIVLSERVKDGLAYKEAFDGREAVDLICEIIKTPDRNLALLLGRALDAQKFFHDVTYDHRLRDSTSELYQFKQKLMLPPAPFADGFPSIGTPPGEEDGSASIHEISSIPPSIPSSILDSARSSISTPAGFSDAHSISDLTRSNTGNASHAPLSPGSMAMALAGEGEEGLPSGVFTLLLDCYSPTCSNTSLCYSIACPRRLEQAKRLNIKPQPGLKKTVSAESLKDDPGMGQTLWATSVSKEVLETVEPEERKRQEAINEFIFTERDFVKDLEYLRDFWIKPLRTRDIIQPPERRDTFVTQVFWNVSSILANNAVLADMLTRRQRSQPIVEQLGDILLERVPLFQPFIDYGGHQQYGKHEFEKEKLDNPEFVKFVDEVERMPESRKIELNGFLTRPTTRLGRYPLLLKAILKSTSEDNPDFVQIPKVLKLFDDFLERVNTAAGKTQNRMDLAQLDSQLRPNESHELRLNDENRELIHKGQLKRRGGTQSETADLEVYLLDNVLVLARYKSVNKTEELRLYKRPIPLELLTMVTQDESYNLSKYGIRPKSLLSRTSTSKSDTANLKPNAKPEKEGKHGFSITFNYLGRRGYSLTLWSASHIQRKKWLEVIDKQQQLVRERNRKIEVVTLETIFTGPNKVNCAAPYDAGRRMVYGTDDGVYFSNLTEPDRPPVMVLSILDVTQVDVLEQFQLLIVLSERSVQTFPLDALDPKDPTAALKRGKRISSHTTFFKAGVCVGKMLVCIVKSSPLSTTIKVMDPVEAPTKKKPQGAAFSKLMPSRHDTLKAVKEFYIPTESSSIHFLKTKLCVGCTKGFEIVDLETLDTQGLLDPADPNLELVHKRDNLRPVRPVAIYRIEADFLLCYDDFAFYVNKNGWRVGGPKKRDDVRWRITWEGTPTHFALQYPWVMAFDPNFVEIWNVNTGVFTQVIQGSNVRLLFADSPPSAIHSAAQLQQQQLQQQQRLAYGRGGSNFSGGAMLPPPRPPPHQQHPNSSQQQQHMQHPPYHPQQHPQQHPPYPPHHPQQQGGYYPPPHPNGQQQMRPPTRMPIPPPPPPVNPRAKVVFYVDDKVCEATLAY